MKGKKIIHASLDARTSPLREQFAFLFRSLFVNRFNAILTLMFPKITKSKTFFYLFFTEEFLTLMNQDGAIGALCSFTH